VPGEAGDHPTPDVALRQQAIVRVMDHLVEVRLGGRFQALAADLPDFVKIGQ
jgi:hypothetical protein